MRIIVNHLTRMKSGYVCIAGVDSESMRHVRPVPRGTRLDKSSLVPAGGPFNIAYEVDIGAAACIGTCPELEDHAFNLDSAQNLRLCAPSEFWDFLRGLAKPTLTEIFGEHLKRRGPWSCGVDKGLGTASLGCLDPANRPELYLRPREGKPPQIRIRVNDGIFDLDLGVTDARLYKSDLVTPDKSRVNRAAEKLEQGVGVILSVGLTRAFPTEGAPEIRTVW
jgi:hypothetical protein